MRRASRQALSLVSSRPFPAHTNPQAPLLWPACSTEDSQQQQQQQCEASSTQHHHTHSTAPLQLPCSPLPFALHASTPGSTRGMAFWSRKQPEPVQSSSIYAEPAAQVFEETQAPTSIETPTDHLPMPVGSEDAVAAVHEACNAVEAAALLAAKEESFFAAGWFIDAITTLHTQAGLPWWGSIAVANLLTRTITLPVMIMSQQATSRMALLNLELLPLKKMQEAMPKVKTQDQQRMLHAAMLEESGRLGQQHRGTIGSTLTKMFGSMILNGFVFLSIFNGVSNLMMHKAPSLTHGGTSWFTDITVPDAYYGLPVLCTLTTLAMVQYGINITGESMDTQKASQAARLKNIFRGMALLFIPFGGLVPSGVALLWVSNSFFSVLLGIALRQDSVRTSIGLPTTKELAQVSLRMQDMMAADPLSFCPASVRAQHAQASSTASAPPPGQPPRTSDGSQSELDGQRGKDSR